MSLQNLNTVKTKALQTYQQKFISTDFVLSSEFKKEFPNINGIDILYHNYYAEATSSNNLKIFIPYQWFVIASYFVEYYIDLINYKNKIETLRSNSLDFKETISSCKNNIQKSKAVVSQIPAISEEEQSFLISFLSDYEWWGGGKTPDRDDFYASPILNLAGLVNNTQAFVAEITKALAENRSALNAFSYNKVEDLDASTVNGFNELNHTGKVADIQKQQIIYYGAPGSGKSRKVKEITDAGITFRTTFHPDTDYASFVGCYKPAKEGDKLTYSFVPQVFTKAYLAAWKAYLKPQGESAIKPVYLVIEEINRGNCAQIFGDIFQLLDRKKGISEYPIDVDSDLAEYIKSDLEKENLWDAYCEKMSDPSFSKIALPENLFIFATMNTSDQSLYPMDSAFKRRFDWEYVPISFEGKSAARYEIENVDANETDASKKTWQLFVERVNEKIKNCLASEDKQIGEYFVNANDALVITENQFISKVLFYLWQEVFKDEPDNESNIFRGKDGNGQIKTFTFQDLFNENKAQALNVILENVGLTSKSDGGGKDRSRYSINDQGSYQKSHLPKSVMEEYIRLNPDLDASTVITNWKALGINRKHFIENQTEFDASNLHQNRGAMDNVSCKGESIYLLTNWEPDTIQVFIDKVNDMPWKITIQKIGTSEA